MNKNITYLAFLRGINVGGNHKVPMADLCKEMMNLGFEKVITILNSGNVIFEISPAPEAELEAVMATHLEKVFGFPVPVLVRQAAVVLDLIQSSPFAQVNVTPDTRLYISFLKEEPAISLTLPWTSADGSYQILEVRDRIICSVLDLAVTPTPKGMDALEQLFGKNITTRNWNTINRVARKCSGKVYI